MSSLETKTTYLQIETIKAEPGDTIIVTVDPDFFDPESCQQILEQYAKMFPTNNIILNLKDALEVSCTKESTHA